MGYAAPKYCRHFNRENNGNSLELGILYSIIFFWVSPISREKWLGVVTEAKFRPGDAISGVIHGFIVQ